ncbi:MAG: aminotransferase class III-fold pyridoxal phosphate-dependent enzyme, partial [Crocinitomicaceae bacterium]|nr:aminotransferase class III-fold pyridoxal phosphate-dependent enzyme [Crocinitomicaceae bacterium]
GVMVSDSIAEHFENHVLPLGLTNAAHPTCLAAAKQALEIYEEEHLLEKVKLRSAYLSQKLEELKEKHDCLGDVRLTGLLGCLEIVKNKTTKERMAPFNASSEEMEVMNKVRKSLSDSGVFTLIRWNYIFITPPFTITNDEIDFALAAISNALSIADNYCE